MEVYDKASSGTRVFLALSSRSPTRSPAETPLCFDKFCERGTPGATLLVHRHRLEPSIDPRIRRSYNDLSDLATLIHTSNCRACSPTSSPPFTKNVVPIRSARFLAKPIYLSTLQHQMLERLSSASWRARNPTTTHTHTHIHDRPSPNAETCISIDTHRLHPHYTLSLRLLGHTTLPQNTVVAIATPQLHAPRQHFHSHQTNNKPLFCQLSVRYVIRP
ncbi:hypothetical protein V8E36_002826 [Tilletia maclaganii]